MGFLLYPYLLFRFWYFEAPLGILSFFKSLNLYAVNAFSLPLLARTFFWPLKNEYRQGLIWFSIMMGVGFKSLLIFISIVMLLLIFLFEILLLLIFLAFPFIPFYLFLI